MLPGSGDFALFIVWNTLERPPFKGRVVSGLRGNYFSCGRCRRV